MFDLSTVPDDLDSYEITEKIDGSLIIPLVINDNIYLRSRNMFFSEHASYAHKLLSDNHKNMILDLNKDGYIVIFEMISPVYRIILDYKKEQLVTIQVRDNNTGRYLNYDEIKKIAEFYSVPVCNKYNITKEEIKKQIQDGNNFEGWVIIKRDNTGYRDTHKIKTEWYKRANCIAINLKENDIIKTFLENKLDDILQDLDQNSEIVKRIYQIKEKVSNYIHKTFLEIKHIIENNKNLDRKSFYEKNKNHSHITTIMRLYGNSVSDYEIKQAVIQDVLRKTNLLQKAIDFLNNI